MSLIKSDALGFLKNKAGKYDAIASAFTLHNFTSAYRRKVLEGIFRSLKPGGIFVNADKYSIDNPSDHKKALQWQLDKIKTSFRRIGRPGLASFWTKHYLEDDKPLRKMGEAEYVSLASRIGFQETSIVTRKHLDAVLVSLK